MIDMEANKKLSPTVTELLLRERKLNIFFILYHNLVSRYLKLWRLNVTHTFVRKLPNKGELQQIVSNCSSDIEIKAFMKVYKDYIKEPSLFLVNNTTLSSDNPLQFRKN